MIVWRLIDTERDRLRIGAAGIDLACRGGLMLAFAVFVWRLFESAHRIAFYPWLVCFPVAAALLYDAAWIWGTAMGAAAVGFCSAALEGLFMRDTTACITAFVFSAVLPWIAAGLGRCIRQVEDSCVLGRVAVRQSDELLTEIQRLTVPQLNKQIDQLEIRLKKYDRLNRLLLDVPEGEGIGAVAAFYVREAENLIGVGHGECFVQSGEDDITLLAVSESGTSASAGGTCRIIEKDEAAFARFSDLMRRPQPILSKNCGEISAPVMSEERPLGILRMTARPGDLSEPDLRILDGLSILASISVMNSLLYQRMEKLARIDGLTGLAKRHVFDTALVDEIQRANRYGHVVAIVMMDIDHFRRFNNTYGHVVGDGVLRELSRHIRETMPPYAVTARWGGEEFVVLLPNEDAKKAAERTVELQKIIADQIRIPAGAAAGTGDDRVTFSAGVVQFPTHGREPQALVNLADEALYQAKHAGRNRVVIHGS